jgi:hypothetical protein
MMTTKNRYRALGIGIGLAGVAVLAACAYVKPACAVIHVADEGCHAIEIIGTDGKREQVPVSNAELEGLARDVAARRAAMSAQPADAGADR